MSPTSQGILYQDLVDLHACSLGLFKHTTLWTDLISHCSQTRTGTPVILIIPKHVGHRSLTANPCRVLQRGLSQLLTLIIALEVMRKRVARSLTALIFSPPSTGTFRPSSSLRERCRAAPCLAIKSLHVLRSSSLLISIFRVPWISLRSDWDVGSSSPESSKWQGSHKKKKEQLIPN